MPKEGWRTVSIREDNIEKLQKIYKNDDKKPQNQYFNSWLDNLILTIIDHEENIHKHGPFIEVLYIRNSEEITLSDYKLDRIIHVFIVKDKKELQCDYCKKTNCVHIGFCYSVPKIYKKLIDLGFRTSL